MFLTDLTEVDVPFMTSPQITSQILSGFILYIYIYYFLKARAKGKNLQNRETSLLLLHFTGPLTE